jgi:predicted dehydrogenase
MVGLNFGRHIVEDLRRQPAVDHIELAAVCDLNTTLSAEVSKRHGVPISASLEEMLDDPSIEAIGLFTSPVGRAALIRQIIRAGKDVITTKPFELNAHAAADVLEEAEQLGRVVHMNSPSPLVASDVRQVQQWQAQYNLGKPVACRREVWAPYRESSDGSWYDDPALCPVAPIFRLGIYLINDLVRLFGEAETVQVMHNRLFTQRPTPDNAQLGILFRNGVMASIFASFCVDDGQFYSNSMILNFERGTIYRNPGPLPYGRAHARPCMAMVARTGVEQTVIAEVEPGDNSGTYQWDIFQRAVRGEVLAGVVTPAQIVEGIKIINAMARAEQSGRSERV